MDAAPLVVGSEGGVADLSGQTALAVPAGMTITPATEMIPPAYHAFPGPPAHVEHMKPKANAPSFFMSDELRMELLNRYDDQELRG